MHNEPLNDKQRSNSNSNGRTANLTPTCAGEELKPGMNSQRIPSKLSKSNSDLSLDKAKHEFEAIRKYSNEALERIRGDFFRRKAKELADKKLIELKLDPKAVRETLKQQRLKRAVKVRQSVLP